MNRALAVVLAAPLIVTACAIPSAAKPATTITEQAPAPTVTVTEQAPEPASDDATYLAFLASKGIYADPATSIDVGHSVCDALDQGTDVQLIMAAAISSGFTVDQGAAIIAAAVMTYCPWNETAATS